MGLAKALTEMTPDQVVNEIVQSGLREEGVVVFRRGSNGDSLNRHRVM
jgi:NADH:ubiquinone oxidoreductase subunit F (NADH-binding)